MYIDHATWRFLQLVSGFIVIGIIIYYSHKKD